MNQTPATRADGGFFGHPRGLQTLFFTEMWERFSYYGMRAFLTLFVAASVEAGGLGMGATTAGLIYGLYTSSVYLLSVPGGWIADRFLGQQRAVFVGGVLIMTGHIVLAIPAHSTFYLGLALVALGTGLLKPNISTMVGQLYGKDDGRRDAGFSIFYMGINLGAFLAPMICGTYLAQSEGFRETLLNAGIAPRNAWHFAFAAAAVGMGIGLVQYVLGKKHLGDAGKHPVVARTPVESMRNKQILVAIIATFVGVPALVASLHYGGQIVVTADALGSVMDYVYIGTALIVFGGLYFFGAENSDERRRLIVMFVLFLSAIVFFACFEQAGSVLTLFAEKFTNREIFGWKFGSTLYQSCNSIFVVMLAPVFAVIWVTLAKKGKEPVTPFKFALGMIFVGLGCLIMVIPGRAAVNGQLSGPFWLVGLYLAQTLGELCLSPVGLSSMSRLAPARWGGLVLGIWFLGSSIGNYFAGRAVKLSESMAYDDFFLLNAAIPIGLGIILALLAKPIFGILKQSPPPPSGH
jgi:proton-dependent oligopeptide transporter, POT family